MSDATTGLPGWVHDIELRLIALGDQSERELLPLLDHSSGSVRRSVAYDIRPFNRELFLNFMESLIRAGGALGHQARRDLESMKQREEWEAKPAAPDPAPDPNWLRILHWQETNPPPSAMRREHFEDRVSTEFSPARAQQILALARPAIGLWPQRNAPSPSPLASRHGGDVWAPPDWEWPIWEEEPMGFLGQIRFADLAGLPAAEALPRAGVLAWFGDHDLISGCSYGGDDVQGAVFHWPEEGLIPTHPPLPPLDEYCREYSAATHLVVRPFTDLPDLFSATVEGLGLARKNVRYDELAARRAIAASPLMSLPVPSRQALSWPTCSRTLISAGGPALSLIGAVPGEWGRAGDLLFMTDEDLRQGRLRSVHYEEQNT